MSKGKVSLIVVEYETKDATNWKAGVLAFNQKEAIDTIKKRVPTYDRMLSIGVVIILWLLVWLVPLKLMWLKG